jgi:ELWxxDGT repeat protein
MKAAFLLICLLPLTALKATGNFSLIEVNPQHGVEQNVYSDSSKHVYGGGEFNNMTEYNGKLYFVAQDTYGNDELWTSDGTQQGTAMVKDINPSGSAQIGNIVIVQGKMVFMATENGTDFDLYSSDGTDAGTVKINETNQLGNDILSPDRAAVFGGKLLFCTSTALISTDGTANGTNTVLSIALYAASPAQGYCELNGYAYFMLTDNLGNPELWRTDGTAGGTMTSLEFSTDSSHVGNVSKLFAFNGKLYLVGYAGGNGNDLYSVEGTVSGHLKKIQLNPNPNLGSNPGYINIVNDQLVFTAWQGNNTSLFKMSMTDTVPQPVASVSGIGVSSGLSICNNSVYFMDAGSNIIHRVKMDDFTHQTIALHGYQMPFYGLGDGSFLVGGNEKVFFAAYDSISGKQVLMESNGTTEGTKEVMPIGVTTSHPFNQILSCGAIDGFDFKMWGNKLVMPANFNDAGRELWIYDASTAAGIGFVEHRNNISVYPNPVNATLNFKTANGYCETAIITDLNGRVLQKDVVAGEAGSIDVSKLPVGNYCVTLSGAGNAATKRFTVTR